MLCNYILEEKTLQHKSPEIIVSGNIDKETRRGIKSINQLICRVCLGTLNNSTMMISGFVRQVERPGS